MRRPNRICEIRFCVSSGFSSVLFKFGSNLEIYFLCEAGRTYLPCGQLGAVSPEFSAPTCWTAMTASRCGNPAGLRFTALIGLVPIRRSCAWYPIMQPLVFPPRPFAESLVQSCTLGGPKGWRPVGIVVLRLGSRCPNPCKVCRTLRGILAANSHTFKTSVWLSAVRLLWLTCFRSSQEPCCVASLLFLCLAILRNSAPHYPSHELCKTQLLFAIGLVKEHFVRVIRDNPVVTV